MQNIKRTIDHIEDDILWSTDSNLESGDNSVKVSLPGLTKKTGAHYIAALLEVRMSFLHYYHYKL